MNVPLDQSYLARFCILTVGMSDSQPLFEMDEQEAADVDVISEHTRPRKPKLDRVIADEMQASKGAIVVACQLTPCSIASNADNVPFARLQTYVNAMVHKIVTAQIPPGGYAEVTCVNLSRSHLRKSPHRAVARRFYE